MREDDPMATKDPSNLTHAERMAALGRDFANPRVVPACDKELQDIARQWLDVFGFRALVAERHNDTSPPPPPPGVDPGAISQNAAVENKGTGPFSRNGTLNDLIDSYRTHEDSQYRKVRFHTRKFYDHHCKRIIKDHGDVRLADIKGSDFLDWHKQWGGDGSSIARSLMTMLRALFGFGAIKFGDSECERLAVIISKFEFKVRRADRDPLTAEHARAICEKAHEMGRPSIALAQALQFELGLRQKEVIGEWVPITEPGDSTVVNGDLKWMRGLRWEEIDNDFVLRHAASATRSIQEVIVRDLKLAPMVRKEIERLEVRPQSGPVVLSDYTRMPWSAHEFRRVWRMIATAAGVPKNVRNMDSRAGGDEENNSSAEPNETDEIPTDDIRQEDLDLARTSPRH